MNIKSSLNGKCVFLFAPDFYKYSLLIKEELEKQGATVISIENKSHPEDLRSSVNYVYSLFKWILNPTYKIKYINSVIDKLVKDGRHIDIFLAINGFSITKELMKYLKGHHFGIKTYLFLWDSLRYWKYSNVIKHFDYKYSFDHADCAKYKNIGLKYHPDFFVSNGSQIQPIKYDFVHIGSLHQFAPDRLRYLSSIVDFAKQNQLRYYIRLYVPDYKESRIKKFFRNLMNCCFGRNYVYYLKEYRKYKHATFIVNERLPLEEVHRIEHAARCIIDIPPAHQTGCTIRSLEALAAGKKLITTNSWIQKESFYDKNNILVMNEHASNVTKDFIYSDTTKSNLSPLKLENWIRTILSYSIN